MKSPILLIATDEPFWRKSTGAWQRISALCNFFHANGISIHVFYPGQLTETDEQSIKREAYTVHARYSDTPPRGILRRAAWHAAGTVHMLKSWLGTGSSSDSGPLTLKDFRWPWASRQFADLVADIEPQFVLVEYVKMTYLLNGLKSNQRDDICVMLDTHDLLHSRARQFADNGFEHWLEISSEEEAAEFRRCDIVIAIQEDEAAAIRKMTPEVRTIVAGHSLESMNPSNSFETRPGEKFTVGYFGSTNFSNWSALTNFLASVWPEVLQRQPDAQLLVAGNICNWLKTPSEIPGDFPKEFPLQNVKLAGFVGDPVDFYNQVDVIVNPVQFGTGKKIKNCEALWYGKPLVTTPAGSAGMPISTPEDQMSIVQVCESDRQIVNAIDELAGSPRLLDELKRRAFETGRSLFSDQHAYRELKAVIKPSVFS
ncbi:MAG: glycosyltransferase [Planctomycetota bacterium]